MSVREHVSHMSMSITVWHDATHDAHNGADDADDPYDTHDATYDGNDGSGGSSQSSDTICDKICPARAATPHNYETSS